MRETYDPLQDTRLNGNTYPLRERLEHEFQGYWDKDNRCWWVPKEHGVAAQTAIDLQPPKVPLSELAIILGNTYYVKDKLKAMGARWDGAEKVWRIHPDQLAEAQAIVPTEETKQCWECGCYFTRRTMGRDGDWSEGYCGC
jgi:hypothetical protein